MKKYITSSMVLMVLLFFSQAIRAEVRLSGLFGDHMVLQRDIPVRIWGWALPGESIRILIQGQNLSTQADANGDWSIMVKPLKIGRPVTLTVIGKNKIVLKDILIGEVWVCGGQSNMEWGIGNFANAAKEIANSNHPLLRLYTVEKAAAGTPQANCRGTWYVCNPNSVAQSPYVGGFSAVAYYFGRDLQKALKVPIGLIHSSWGGTAAESWMSREAMMSDQDFKNILEQMTKTPPPEDRSKPCFLYNGMIEPLVPFTIRGVIWYQGESNSGAALTYRKLFPALISDWRKAWNQGDFPFLFVQLAGFGPVRNEPGESQWAELREAQLMTLSVPNTAMAVAADIGDTVNIHPPNKQDVGKRLALAAQALVYKQNIVSSGPIYDTMAVEGNKIRLKFKHIAGGLAAGGKQPLKGFAVAGVDKKFLWAQAKIEGETVVVWSDKIPHPIAVRYAWADNPIGNLYNQGGLPASPFRTDSK